MSFEPLSADQAYADATNTNTTDADDPERLSQNGQMLGIAVFGGLLLVGFFFGIVTGYDNPKPVVIVKKDKEPAKPETPAPKPTPKVTPPTELNPPTGTPKEDPPKKEPSKVETPKENPPKKDPPKVVEPPKKDPPKVDIAPKKEDPPTTVVKALSFEKDVKPILRSYCFNCHGAAGKPKGDVDLTSLAKITAKGAPDILTPGDPKKSAILATIEDMSMPPNGARPGKGETEVIRNWILAGAKP